jgi:hypothetical protein
MEDNFILILITSLLTALVITILTGIIDSSQKNVCKQINNVESCHWVLVPKE